MYNFEEMNEKDFQEYRLETPETLEELMEIIEKLTEREHNYNTTCFAMSIAAFATFEYVASKLKVTGWQASCSSLDFLRRAMNIDTGYRIILARDALFPQYCNRDKFPFWTDILRKNKDELLPKIKKLIEKGSASDDVMAHWKRCERMMETDDYRIPTEDFTNDILRIPKVIKEDVPVIFRWNKGGLRESLESAKIFKNVRDLESYLILKIPEYNCGYFEIGDTSFNDDRIGWEDTRYVRAGDKNLSVIGLCATIFPKTYSKSYEIYQQEDKYENY